MRRALIVAIALLAGASAAGLGKDKEPKDFERLANASTCRAWTEMRGRPRDAARTRLQAWLPRTVIGDWNAPVMPGSDAGLDYAGIFGLVDVFCAADPGKTLKDAAEMLIEDMDSR